MILQWMAYAALCAALVGVAAACVDGILGSLRRARRMVWLIAIAASTLVPLALPLRSRADIPSTAPRTPVASPSSADASAQSATSTTNRLDLIVLSAWAVASGLFALVLLVAHRRTTAALKSCRAGTIGGNPALISVDLGPAVVGVLRHHIVVPSWTLALHDDEQRLVVAHELEHARSGDPLLSLAGVCAVLVMPWNVALWWQLSRLRLAIELDCDARVVAHKVGDALSYSKLLLSVGERGRATRHPVLAMSRSRSALAKRFDALLRRDAIEPLRVAVLAMLAAGTVASVAFVPSPNVADVVAAIRVRRSLASPTVVAPPVQTATFAPPVSAQPAGAVQRKPTPSTNVRSRNRASSLSTIAPLPPIAVVPSGSSTRGPLDSVVVARATILPMTTRRGGILMASPNGSAGRGGFSATAVASPASGADSNRVIRAGGRGGGRATLVPRPDTSARPPIA